MPGEEGSREQSRAGFSELHEDRDGADGACGATADLEWKAYEAESPRPTSLSRLARHSMCVIRRSPHARWAWKLGSPSGAGLTASTPNMPMPRSASQCTLSTARPGNRGGSPAYPAGDR